LTGRMNHKVFAPYGLEGVEVDKRKEMKKKEKK
jgi:hypothetical protein